MIQVSGLKKAFDGFVALNGVDMHVEKGAIYGLVGPNGAGKSTLIRHLTGVYRPDQGEVQIDGENVYENKAVKAKIAYIPDELFYFMQADTMEMKRFYEGIYPSFDGKLFYRMQEFFPNIDVKRNIRRLSKGMQKQVAFWLAICCKPDILILDEPTAVLTPQETDKLFAILRNMRNAGKAIVIITHKMHEVESLSDRVAVLRKGQYVGDVMTRDTNAEELTNMMVGHPVKLNIERTEPVNPRPRIEVKDLIVRNEEGTTKLDHVSFTANSGEILGIAGIAGSGQKELLEAIAGLQPVDSGSISYIEDDGTHVELIGKDPLTIQNMGVSLSFVPEDRLGMGLVGNMDLSDNMMLRTFRKGHSFFTDRKSPRRIAENVVKELEVATPSLSTPIRRLSGGNVQKVLVGREITSAPKVLLTAYAVRGLDIHSSYTIYNLINNQKKQNVAVVYVGEDLDVLVELCDRILVLCGGKVSGIVPGRGADKREIGMMMTRVGGNEHE